MESCGAVTAVRRLLRRPALRVVLSLLLLALLGQRVEWRPVGALLARIRSPAAAAAVVLFVAAQGLSALKWRWLAATLGCARPVGRHLRLYFAAMFLSLFLPSFVGGDLFRAARLGEGGWRPSRAALVSVFLERATGLWGLLLVAAVGLSVARGGWLGWAAVVALLGAAAVVRRWPRLVAVTPAVLVASVAVQSLYVAVHVALAVALALPLGWRPWLWIGPVVGLVASLPISLGGLGPREWGYVALLQRLGVGETAAAAFACAWLALVTGVSLGGGIALLGGRGGQTAGEGGVGRRKKGA
ncbi:MAG: hypothetical protein AUK30_02105 [Nitrospirae bacterium CG2_30_70_394]|nr:MAG: hypothetical protein AUK30_02105 [Nitrospirae bacterium CG2_30_70_394]PJB96108.1 MAG: hypothetical protein CO080_04200 [Nitrospirae bacterium CG_4_9_14_0_8_um_filter_70_14]